MKKCSKKTFEYAVEGGDVFLSPAGKYYLAGIVEALYIYDSEITLNIGLFGLHNGILFSPDSTFGECWPEHEWAKVSVCFSDDEN